MSKIAVPEYESKCFLVKKLFWNRISHAIRLGKVNNKKVLDIGCGEGQLIRQITKNGTSTNIIGIDTIQPKSQTFSFVNGNATKLPFKPESFDTAFALDVLEHIPNASLAIRQAWKVLKQEGILVISVPTETFFYKFCRFLIKGKFNIREHIYNAKNINDKVVSNGFIKTEEVCLPNTIFAIMKVIKYRKATRCPVCFCDGEEEINRCAVCYAKISNEEEVCSESCKKVLKKFNDEKKR